MPDLNLPHDFQYRAKLFFEVFVNNFIEFIESSRLLETNDFYYHFHDNKNYNEKESF